MIRRCKFTTHFFPVWPFRDGKMSCGYYGNSGKLFKEHLQCVNNGWRDINPETVLGNFNINCKINDAF